jgi:hypothetical protein
MPVLLVHPHHLNSFVRSTGRVRGFGSSFYSIVEAGRRMKGEPRVSASWVLLGCFCAFVLWQSQLPRQDEPSDEEKDDAEKDDAEQGLLPLPTEWADWMIAHVIEGNEVSWITSSRGPCRPNMREVCTANSGSVRRHGGRVVPLATQSIRLLLCVRNVCDEAASIRSCQARSRAAGTARLPCARGPVTPIQRVRGTDWRAHSQRGV